MQIVLYKSELSDFIEKIKRNPIGERCALVSTMARIGDNADDYFLSSGWNSQICVAAGADAIKKSLVDWKQQAGAAAREAGNGTYIDAFGLKPTIEYLFYIQGRLYEDIRANAEDPIVVLNECYNNSFAFAESLDCDAIIFPSMLTGRGRFPVESAAKWVAENFNGHLDNKTVKKVVIVSHNAKTIKAYDTAFAQKIPGWKPLYPEAQ